MQCNAFDSSSIRIIFQMMITMGWVFMSSVFTFFVVFQCFMQTSEIFAMVTGIRTAFFLFMFLNVLMLLNMGSTVSRQVYIIFKLGAFYLFENASSPTLFTLSCLNAFLKTVKSP